MFFPLPVGSARRGVHLTLPASDSTRRNIPEGLSAEQAPKAKRGRGPE